MKLLVETTGEFQVYAAVPEQWAQAHRPSVVTESALMSRKIASDELRVLGKVNDDATDALWVAHMAEAGDDQEFAVESFVSEFPTEKPVKAAKAPKEPKAAE